MKSAKDLTEKTRSFVSRTYEKVSKSLGSRFGSSSRNSSPSNNYRRDTADYAADRIWIEQEMNQHKKRRGEAHHSEASGWGDSSLGANIGPVTSGNGETYHGFDEGLPPPGTGQAHSSSSLPSNTVSRRVSSSDEPTQATDIAATDMNADPMGKYCVFGANGFEFFDDLPADHPPPTVERSFGAKTEDEPTQDDGEGGPCASSSRRSSGNYYDALERSEVSNHE